MDRMAVNAAIEQLTAGGTEGWQDAAQLVVDFGINIAPSGAFIKNTGSSESSRSDEVVSGYSPGAGNVEVRTPAQQKTGEACSAPVERVGYYRVMHTQHIRVLRIEHYRQSGSFRRSPEDGDEFGYVLTYTRDFRPDSFFKLILRETSLSFRVRLLFEAQTLLRYLQLLPRMFMTRLQGGQVILRRKARAFRAEFVVINSMRTELTPEKC